MTEFDKVYQKYFRDVYRKYLLVLSAATSGLRRRSPRRPSLKSWKSWISSTAEAPLYSWLCQIAKHTYFDHCRREKRKGREEDVGRCLAPG